MTTPLASGSSSTSSCLSSRDPTGRTLCLPAAYRRSEQPQRACLAPRFDSSGKLQSARISNYLLEKSRIAAGLPELHKPSRAQLSLSHRMNSSNATESGKAAAGRAGLPCDELSSCPGWPRCCRGVPRLSTSSALGRAHCPTSDPCWGSALRTTTRTHLPRNCNVSLPMPHVAGC